MSIEFSTDKPAIYDRINEIFGVEFDDGIIISYYPKIHCKVKLSADKIVHEMMHMEQQKNLGVELWWNLFFSDEGFRLEQEVEAYRAEAAFIRRNIKDRNAVARFIHNMAVTLSSKIYGNICDYSEAMQFLK